MKALQCGAILAVGVLAGCGMRTPTLPTRNVPPGVVMFRFTRKVKGPVELTLDGVRVPVSQKIKAGQHLVVKGLAPGRHKYFLMGSKEAFGPDQGEFEVRPGGGLYLVTFSTNFDAVLYGKGEAAPAAEGIPGVQASLEK